jgi:hypothetical protein
VPGRKKTAAFRRLLQLNCEDLHRVRRRLPP